MKFTAIVCSHTNERGLLNMLANLRYQTRPPDETIVFASDTPTLARLAHDFPDVEFLERPNMNDWGHEKRAEGVERATGDWLGFFNDDDSYERDYLELMLAEASRLQADAVYCGWNTHPDCHFGLASSTSGNFIVRTDVARTVGYTSRRYEADGDFITAVAEIAERVGRVDRVLYHHNVQER